MEPVAPLIYDLAIMLGMASVVGILFRRIKQPVVLGYLIAGVIVGPHTPPYELINDVANIKTLSELGVIFLMFSLGLEFSFAKLVRVGLPAGAIGFVEVIAMVLLGFAAGKLMQWDNYESIFLGAAISISSTTIIIKVIEELGLQTKKFAELVFGILIVEDLLAILLLVALSTIVANQKVFSFDLVKATLRLIIVVGSWIAIGYFLVPRIFSRIAHYINQETLTILSVSLCLGLVCVSDVFNYSDALGAFIMGSILAETILIKRIEEIIKPIRDIFAAVFFISVGMLINPVIIIHNWLAVVVIALITIFGKIITTGGMAMLMKESKEVSVRAGFSMAQVGEFSFIIAGLGLELGVTSDKLYPLIVAVSSVTAFTTPYLIRLSGRVLENKK